MRSILFLTASAALTLGTVALAIVTPVTEQNRKPIAAFILASTFIGSPALLIAAAQD